MSLDLHLAPDIGGSSLLGLVGGLEGRTLAVEGARQVLGRDASKCHLVLEHALISREHAVFETDENGRVFISDLNSSQGTFVNGRQVTRQQLRHGDTVGFGRKGVVAFRFQQTPAAPRSARPQRERISADKVRARLASSGEAALRMRPPSSPPSPPVAAPPPSLPPSVLRIGRAPDNDIVLESAAVSRYHAQLAYSDDGPPVLSDPGSTNGTYVNGEVVQGDRALGSDDLVYLGGFILRVRGRDVTKYDLSSSRVIASGIGQQYGDRTILQDISFAILPREFIGLMGPSGCGKSTLMDALNGLRPAKSGTVSINDLDLYQHYDAVRRSIGYVPQRDVLHDALTVERTLHYAAKLRLPVQTSEADRQRVIDEAIATVGLQDHRMTPFDRLSGGQQKRLSLALELLTKPNFLFLDEPTSPLDPETSENLMLLFRRLADEGRIVVMVTHKFEKFEQMHQIALLTKGGRLAFFGPPKEALRYFDCSEPGDIYRQIAGREAAEVAQTFQTSPHYQAHVGSRLTESHEVIGVAKRLGGLAGQESRAPCTKPSLRQWAILTHRYAEIKLKDRRNTALLVAQAPVIAFILAMIAGDTVNDSKTLFIAAIIAIWFGANNAAREIVADWPMYSRERMVHLTIPSYVFSKFAVLAAIGTIQCTLLVATLTVLDRLRLEDVPSLLPTLLLTTASGIGLGLLFSAVVNTTEKAMSVLPLLLIPQLLLSGFLKPVDDVYYNARTGAPATAAQYDRDRTASTGQEPANAPTVPPDPIVKVSGLGNGSYAAGAMIARWSVDALVHGVGRSDVESRDRLASQMSVSAYASVQDGMAEADVASAYGRRVYFDWLVLVTMTGIYLAIAAWALRAKDRL